jgi:zinc protease
VVQVPAVWQEQFKNGLRVMGTRNTEIPSVTLQLTIRGGHRLEQADPTKAGIASLTAAMLNEGSQKYSGEEFTAALNRLGSTVQVLAGEDNTTVQVQSLTKNLDQTLALVEERLMRPRFDATDFARIKKQTLEGIANQNTQPRIIANKTYSRLLYGPDDIMSIPVSGTQKSVESITLDDVKQFYAANYAPNISHLVAVGDVEQQALLPKLSFLQNWSRKEVALPADKPATKPNKTKLYFVNKDDAAQSEIRIGYLALPYDATGDYYKSYLSNYILGDAFNSRVNLNLREDKGYTYGAFSGFSGSRYTGPFTANAGVRADATAASVKEFVKEIDNYRKNGITDEELEFLKSSVGQNDALRYETGQQKAGFLARMLEYDLTPDYLKKQTEILQKLTKEDVKANVEKYLPLESMVLVVTGDKKYLPELQKLGYEVTELDLDGNPVKADMSASYNVVAPAAPEAAAATDKKAKRKIKSEDGKKMKIKEKSEKTK